MATQAETLLLLRKLADETQLAVLLITHDENAAVVIADNRLIMGVTTTEANVIVRL